jgi:hypothetical protein
MDHPEGASETSNVRLGFDRRVRLEFHGSKISSDGGLLLFRELDEVLGLHGIAGGFLRDTRTGHNRLHSLVGLLRQGLHRAKFSPHPFSNADFMPAQNVSLSFTTLFFEVIVERRPTREAWHWHHEVTA